jgi:hypothetical protein
MASAWQDKPTMKGGAVHLQWIGTAAACLKRPASSKETAEVGMTPE